MFIHAIRHEKLLVLGPSIATFRQPNFIVTERFSMRCRGVYLVRRTIANVTIQHDECWPPRRFFEDAQSLFDTFDVISISDSQHVPSISQETSCNVLRECQLRVPF